MEESAGRLGTRFVIPSGLGVRWGCLFGWENAALNSYLVRGGNEGPADFGGLGVFGRETGVDPRRKALAAESNG